ncbi:hypothetical protein LIER_08895 [Lithospermum erythrorhizon]|uniref:GAGA-binding transcriptional activator n=1 Tax=Lithospermum erythrorhizon TaxID=34254 RepID=A0AAV3PHM0_LITER
MNSCIPIAAIPIRSVAPVTSSSQNVGFDYAEYHDQNKSESFDQTHRKESSSSAEHNEIVDDDANCDFSEVPPPICSCTAVARRCYKNGPAGWQSTCCTMSLSEFPLPKSPSGRRMKGRKISGGAYTKLLRKLAREGHDLSQPVDLKNHWNRRG